MTDGTDQPASRLSAKLGHYQNVRRVEQKSPTRVTAYVTNNGLGPVETRTIRSYGWEVIAVSPRFNSVSLKRINRSGRAGVDHAE